MSAVRSLACAIGIAALSLLVACSDRGEASRHVGYVEGEWRYIASPQSGWIVQIPVQEGMRVAEGELLFELDSGLQQANLAEASARVAQADADVRDVSVGARPEEIRRLEAELARADAHLAQAKAERDRILPLVERGIESPSRRDEVEAGYRSALAARSVARESIAVAKLSARSAVRDRAAAAARSAEASKLSAEWHLSERVVTARTAGRVEELFHYEGEFAIAGTPILAILPDDGLKVRFFVSQEELPDLDLGKEVQVRADGLREPVEGRITFIASEAEFTPPVVYSNEARAKLVFLIEAQVPSKSGLHVGLPVDVDWR
jgi:HlyD family secretion protein